MNKKLLFLIFFVFLFSLSCVNAEFQVTYGESNQFDNLRCYSYLIEYQNEEVINPTWGEKISASLLGTAQLEEQTNQITYSFFCHNNSNWNDFGIPGRFNFNDEILKINGKHIVYNSGEYGNTTPKTIEYSEEINCSEYGDETIYKKLPYYFNHGDSVVLDLCIYYQEGQNLTGDIDEYFIEPGKHILENGTVIYVANPIIYTSNANNIVTTPLGTIFFDFPTAYSSGSCNDDELTKKELQLESIEENRGGYLTALDLILNFSFLIYTIWLIFYWIIKISVLLFGMFVLFKAIIYLYTKMKRLLE